ncbi:Major intrinsic protein [Arabidopsis suecica]|nr:aquaporin NIP3-1 isoform X1 [Arabidopsis lyrata subsp. lyrata]KAG7598938.1 Major intrinsic protein [Arabidopsis suecica]|eukprot:XP_002890955.2 aquaporin NIP3-1 isoform X1 [Arabidopsis lyrata subsp. lyrata]
MAEISDITTQAQTVVLNIDRSIDDSRSSDLSGPLVSVSFVQKLIGEFVGTFSMIFAGCSAIVVNETYGKPVTLPGIALVWGLTVTVMIYSIGHVSGAHFNPAVSIAFASSKKFPFNQVPGYIAAQVLGSTLAAAALRLVFHLNDDVCSLKGDVYVGTYPSNSTTTSFVMEFIATFNLMFVISAVATDKRATGSLAGIAIGATVVLDILFSGPISGASMNPARSLGPALIWGCYKDLWLYIISPVLGALSGAWTYDLLRSTKKSYSEIIRPNCNKVSSRDHQEASQDEICVLRVVDPANQNYFICSSPNDINGKCNVTCKLA